MMAKGLNCPLTSSCGRLFDAVSALLGVCLVSDYEGQAAMLLEHQAHLALDEGVPSFYPPTLREEEGITLIETAPLAALICRDLSAGVAITVIARRFHLWLVASLGEILKGVRQQTGITDVVLSGGCMQNKLLFETLADQVRAAGFSVHAGELAPMNDGGIALGQAFIGGHECV
jgi:hydrogenase maturation protein HypF